MGSILLTLDVLPNEFPKATKIDAAASAGAQIAPSSGPSAKVATIRVEPAERMPVQSGHQRPPHASPSIRRMSRELGIDLSAVRGTGPRGRIVKDDLQRFVKAALSSPVTCEDGSMSGLKLAPWPTVDFSKFGKVERTQLSKLRKLSGTNLSRNANVIPHVTNFEDADITDLDAFRCTLNLEMNSDVKLTVLPFFDQGCGRDPCEVRRIQRLSGRRRFNTQAILSHRVCRRHRKRIARSGDPRCRP